jgi:hypothetical protein
MDLLFVPFFVQIFIFIFVPISCLPLRRLFKLKVPTAGLKVKRCTQKGQMTDTRVY